MSAERLTRIAANVPADELERPPVPPLPFLAPAEIVALLTLEAQLLDARRLEEWLSLLTSDFVYWVPAEHGQTDAESRISLVYDDRAILEDRVWRLKHPKMFSQNPQARQVRVVSGMVTDGAVDPATSSLVVRSKFVMFEHRQAHNRTFGGDYEHRLVRDASTGGEWRIASKTVRLANCDAVLWNVAVPL